MNNSSTLVPRNHKSIPVIALLVIMIITLSFKSPKSKIDQSESSFSLISFPIDTTKRTSVEPPIEPPTILGRGTLKLISEKTPIVDKPTGQDSNGEYYYDIVTTPPYPPDGIEGWTQYLSSNLKYPKEAQEKGITGTVIAKFIVKKDGSLYDLEILRGIGGGCDEELLRVIKNSPNWTAGKLETGEAVNTKMRMPVQFK